MKIIVMGTGQGIGGLHTHFQRLLKFAVAEGHETLAFVVANREKTFWMPLAVRSAGRIPHESAGMWKKISKFIAVRELERTVTKSKPDIFIATATGGSYARLARRAKDCGAFTIWQEVMLPSPCDPLHSEMSRSVHAVAVQTPGMLQPFLSAIRTVGMAGCLPCFFEPVMTASIASPPRKGGEIRLAYFGRLAANKGLVPFLEIFREVTAVFPVSLDIHGGGEDRDAIERKIAETGLAEKVTLKGRYPDGESYGQLLASYHGLVLPSVECEGLPLVLLEAMSCGLPFLSTTIGGIADAGVDNLDVVIVPPDADSLRVGLREFLSLLRDEKVSNSRLKAYASDRFSNETFAATWREMLASPRDFFSITGTNAGGNPKGTA